MKNLYAGLSGQRKHRVGALKDLLWIILESIGGAINQATL